MVIPKAGADPNAGEGDDDGVVAAAGVVVLLPNKLEPAPVDAGATVAGSEDVVLPKLNELVSDFETGVVS